MSSWSSSSQHRSICLFIPFDEQFHIPALARVDQRFSHLANRFWDAVWTAFSLAMKQRQWQHTMAWWWTTIRSNTWDDLPSDKDFKSRCVSFWCCLKSLKCFETTNQIKCSQLGKQRQASPKKAQSRVAARIDAARAMRRFASICFYYLHLSMYRMIIHPSIIYL